MKSVDLVQDNRLQATLYFNLEESECRGCNDIYTNAILQELKLSSEL